MDNHHFPIQVFIAQDPDNEVDTEDMPELVPLDAQGSHATEPQQPTTADVEMNGEYSNMRSLASLSDSSEEDNDDSESDRDAHEVEMQTVNDHRLSDQAVPNLPSTSRTSHDQPAVNNRRARVEDDEDEDRDRRHPSQRIGSSANATSSSEPSSSTPVLPPSQIPTFAPQPTPGARLRGQAPIFRTVVDEGTRPHPFRFFQHLMSNNINNNNNNDAGNANFVPPSGGPMPAPQPHQDGNTPVNQPHGRHPIIEGFSLTLDIGLGPPFHMGGAQPPEGEPTANPADPNLNPNPNAQNGLPPNANFADFMARFGLFGQPMGQGENAAEGTTGTAAPAGGNNPDQGAGGAGATPGAQFGFNFPAGAFNLANLAGLGFGFNLDGSGFAEKEDPERARRLVDGLEEVPVGLVRRLERVGGTGGGMGEDETKGGDGGCAICWDRLLGGHSTGEDVHWHQESEKKEEGSKWTQSEEFTGENEASTPTLSKIVCLPCAHVFHAECLIPWFSRPRQTTCPTCRFNIDPENLTYVSWRRRMRERRERERAEARARGDPQNTDSGEAAQEGIVPPPAAATSATAAETPVPPLLDGPPIISQHVLNFPTSLESSPLVPVRSQTPNASVLNAHPTPAPRSQSQPPSVQAAASSSSPGPSTSQPRTRPEAGATFAGIHGRAPETADDWDAMPGLQDVSDSEDEDEDEYEDEERDEAQEQENGHGIQLPHANETPIASTQTQTQAPPLGRNDPLAPRTIQTAHGLVTLIPVPFNFPLLPAGNGVGVGVQAGGNAANAPAGQNQGQPPNVNANANTQALPQGHPHGLAFPHFNVQLPHMPEFGAQRGPQGAAPALAAPGPGPANATAATPNGNPNQALPTNAFVNAQEAAAITNTEEQLMQHLLLQGLTADQAEDIRRSTVQGRQADRLRRGEDPAVHPDSEDEDEDDMMMDIDEGMGMVVDMTVDQGGMGGIGADPATIAAQDEQDRQEFAQVINFLNHTARHARGQAQAGTQTQGQAQQQEWGTEGAAAGDPGAQQQQPQPQLQPQQQQQGQVFAPFMAGLNAGFNIGNHMGNLGAGDGRMNEFVAQFFANLTGGAPQHARQQAQPTQGQDAQPQPQAQPQSQPQAGQGPAEGPNPTHANNNGGRPRQQAQFAFGNVTIGPFTNIASLFDQIPMFNPNSAANGNVNGGQERVKKAWTLPPAPGPTLRQRIERRERDAGLRCYDISCGVGPSDEDPVVSDEVIAAGLRQLMIMNKIHGPDGKIEGVCTHTFHPGCLVSAERVALGGTDVNVIEGGDVEVSCPVCRSAGCVTIQQWDEGVSALA